MPRAVLRRAASGRVASLLTLGAILGACAARPTVTHAPEAPEPPLESRTVESPVPLHAVGVWMGIASASGLRSGGGAGAWLNLVAHSARSGQPLASPTPEPPPRRWRPSRFQNR